MLEVATQKIGLADTGYCFRSTNPVVLTEDDFVKEMVNYNSTLTEVDARASMTMFGTLFKKHVARGDRVVLPFGTFRTVANGTCENADDVFKAGVGNNKISVVFEINMDTLAEIRKEAKYKIVASDPVSDVKISELIVSSSDGGKADKAEVKAGRPIRLRGRYMSFDLNDETQGVFLETESSKVRITDYYHRGRELIDFFVPEEMEAGEYTVSVVTKPRKNCYTTGVAPVKLTVK